MKPRLLACLAVLLSSSLACAAQVPIGGDLDLEPVETARMQAAQAASDTWFARIAAELATSGEARDLAFAALLLDMVDASPAGPSPYGDAPARTAPPHPRVEQWRQLASARAGSDVVANALLLGGQDRAGSAVRAQALDRWRRLEPDNLAPLLYGEAGDWLPAAGVYRRLDLHYYDQLRWMQATLAAHPPDAEEQGLLGDGMPAEQVAALAAAGMMAAVAMPGLRPLAEACRGEALEDAPTRRGDCRQVAQMVADISDIRLGTDIGISLLQATATTPAQQADAQARRRHLDWQMLAWGRTAGAQPDEGAAQFVRLLHDPAVRSERDLVERVLSEARVPLDPPPNWRSPRR